MTLNGGFAVNGVTWDTSNALISIERRPGSLAELSAGQVVAVTGKLAADGLTGTADKVAFGDLVEGPVQSIDSAARRMVVMGQPVRVSADAVVNGTAFDALAVGDIVEVSGFVVLDGSIEASYVARKPSGGEFEVSGLAVNVDRVAMTFEINGLTVDYRESWIDGFPQGMPEDGQLVEVRGVSAANSERLLATRIVTE